MNSDTTTQREQPVTRKLEEALAGLLEVTQGLNLAGDMQPGLDRVAARLGQYIDFTTFGVLLLDDFGRELRFVFARGFPASVVEHWRFGMGQGLVGTAAAERRMVYADNVKHDERYIGAGAEVCAELAVPLVAGERTIGVLDVGAKAGGLADEGDRRLLSFLADHLAVALENARIVANMQEQAQTLSLLHELSREFTSILDREEILRRMARRIGRIIDYDVFSVMLWNEQSQLLEPALSVYRDAAHNGEMESLPLGRGICGTAAALRQSVRVPNVQLDPRYIRCVQSVEVASELAVPLVIKDRLVGVLDLESARYDAFSSRHQQMLSTLASALAIALENASLYEKLQVEERKLADDLAMARQVQQQLLPKATPWVQDLQIGVAYDPARHLGGDFYEFLPYGKGRVAVAVGDVSGKATSAALFGALAVGTLREYAVSSRRGPARSLADMNRKLQRLGLDNRFVAMLFCVYEAEERILRVANAGLPYPYLVREGRPKKLEVGGVPLGLLAGQRYQEVRWKVRPGDMLVIASDGVEDALNDRGEEFGRERLELTLRRLAGDSATRMASGLLEATQRFTGGAESYDDRTIVALKLTAGE